MMLYVDTSLIVAALTNEMASAAAQAWLAAQSPARLAISHWTITEFSSAISIKVRSGEIPPEQQAPIIAEFESMLASSLTLLNVSSIQFVAAARFLDNHALGLRAGDALHLAIAASHGATVHTLGKHMARAGTTLGITTLLL